VEVLSDNTLLQRLESPEPQNTDAEEDSLRLGLFLDFLSRQALSSDQGPVLYTEAMAAEDDDRLAGVSVDAGQEAPGA
jgi:antitoxin PrlF